MGGEVGEGVVGEVGYIGEVGVVGEEEEGEEEEGDPPSSWFDPPHTNYCWHGITT